MKPSVFCKSWDIGPNGDVKDIGEIGLYHLNKLNKFLWALSGENSKPAPTSFSARTATSIITRGEAFMLGTPCPRFAIRAYYKLPSGDCGGFIHVRRIGRLLDEISHSDRIYNATKRSVLEKITGLSRWHKQLLGGSCIADSLIKVPLKYNSNGWHVLTAPPPVVKAYGEEEEPGYVPYFQHLAIAGGGMCAQACCFMAMLLSYDRTSQIHCIPDITCLGRDNSPPEMTMLGGLDVPNIVNYFTRHTDLLAYNQINSDNHINAIPTEINWAAFEVAIVAYLRAGFPVILPVDKDRLKGRDYARSPCPVDNIYFLNGVPDARAQYAPDRKKPRNQYHCVLAVGYRKVNNTTELLFNDPGEAPFLSISIPRLSKVTCYMGDPSSS